MGKIMRNGVQYGNPAIPYASNNVPGLVKIGSGVNISPDGTISVPTPSTPSLGDLTDVDLTTPPASGDVLGFNGSEWAPQTPSSGGGGTKIYDASGSRYYDSGQWRYSQTVYEANEFDATKPFVVFLHIDVPAATNQFNDRLACDQTIYLPSSEYGDTYYLHFYTKGGDPRGFLVMSAEVTITNISATAFKVNITLHNDSKKITVSGNSVSSAAYSPSTTYNASFKVGVMQ